MTLEEFKLTLTNFNAINLLGPVSDPLLTIDPNLPTLLIDGGANYLDSLKFPIYTIVGDLDSIKSKHRLKMNNTPLNRNKDYSDFAYALSIIPKNIVAVYCFALFPSFEKEKNVDYWLANMGEVYQWAKLNECTLFLNDQFCLLPKGSNAIVIEGEFSIFSLEFTTLSLNGKCKYRAQNKKILPLSSLGLSNEGDGVIEIICPKPLFIFQR